MPEGGGGGLGRLFSPDPRDRQYRAMRLLPATVKKLDTRTTWRFKGAVLDQGSTGTCVGHAWRHFLRCAPTQTIKSGPSAFDIYRGCVTRDVWPDNDDEAGLPDADAGLDFGTSVRAGAEFLTGLGRIKSYVWCFTLAEATTWVLTMGPLVLGTDWYSGFDSPDAEGIVRLSGGLRGGHAYLMRGVDMKRGLARCVNSWGAGWGRNGQFLVPFEALEPLIANGGEACSAVEQRVKPVAP